VNTRVLWRAGCAETRTSGSVSGPEKRTVGNDGNALRSDFYLLLVAGNREQVAALRAEVAQVLAPIGLRLSERKTRIAHIDEGVDFLGFRIQRHRQRGSDKRYVYTYPSKKSLQRVINKVRTLTSGSMNLSLPDLLRRVNSVLRGWANYFKHGVSKRTFSYLDSYAWRRVVGWLRRKHHRRNWKWLRRRHLPGWRPTEGTVTLFNPAAVTVSRYRYRGEHIPTPWSDRPAA
jgi:RNA-directed DNA polymerase